MNAGIRVSLSFLVVFGCLGAFPTGGYEVEASAGFSEAVDGSLAPFQRELLDLAFQTATSIPVYPHIKDRSKAQEWVVRICLRLDQPVRAFDYIGKIEDWRRGLCYAELAVYLALRDVHTDAHRCLSLAGEVADKELDKETGQEWRRERIRVKMAQAYALLGQTEQACVLNENVHPSEVGKLAGTQAMLADDEAFDTQIATLDALLASGDFDVTKNVLGAYSQLFNRFYGNEPRRSLAAVRIRNSWARMPLFIRIDLLHELAVYSLAHDDPNNALELVDEAQGILDGAQWPPDHAIRNRVELAALRWRAGDCRKARDEVTTALLLYSERQNEIVNINRAGVLRSIAEALRSMGDAAAALSVYRQAIEAGMVNPNSRPRAEDLSATCCSMALSAVEPDESLLSHIRQVYEGLGDPW